MSRVKWMPEGGNVIADVPSFLGTIFALYTNHVTGPLLSAVRSKYAAGSLCDIYP